MKRFLTILILVIGFPCVLSFEYMASITKNVEQKTVIKLESQPIQIPVEEIRLSETDIAINNMQKELDEIESIADNKNWFIAYKNVVEKYSDVLDPPESMYDYYSQEELDLMCRVVQAEIGDEYSFEQKCNVASVIWNRLEHEEFGNTLSEVLTKDQFSTISNGRYKTVEVSEDTILACEYTFMICDTTSGCLFFDSNGVLNYEFTYNDEAHNFYKLKGE